MKRLILFLLALLGFSFTSCEPKEEEILPMPEYGVPYATFHPVDDVPAADADNTLKE
ncbi:MAG: hypothetical protein J6R38_04910 [Alistipes sp.]|nr:hypothetical protein [Alistipes sp.]